MKTIYVAARVVALFSLAMTMTSAVLAEEDEFPPNDTQPVPELDSGSQGEAIAEVGNCAKTFNSGSGITRLSWCFSNDGNIVKMEHSQGIENVRIGSFIEGFCVSSNNVVHGSSLGDIGNIGLNPAVVLLGTNKIKHTTTDGVWRIEQTFSQNIGTKTIAVTMKLFNLSGVAQSSIFVTRAVDADMANTTANDTFVSGARSVLAAEPGSSRMVLATTNANTTNTMIYPVAGPVFNAFCYDPASDGVNISSNNDVSMGLLVQLGTVPAGGNTTVKFTYQLSI